MKNITLFAILLMSVGQLLATNYYSTRDGMLNSNIWSTVSSTDTMNLVTLSNNLFGNDSVFISHKITTNCNTVNIGLAGRIVYLIVYPGASLTVSCNTQMRGESTLWVNGSLSVYGDISMSGNALICGYGTTSFYGNFSTSGNASDCSSLPIELVYFKGAKQNNTMFLEWHTQTETNNLKYELERSLNGVEFKSIVEIAGAGNSVDEHFYSFTDTEDLASYLWVYYRLKQTDYNGKINYSEIIAIETSQFKSEKESFLYPNPAKVMFNLEFDTEFNDGKIIVYNNNGELKEMKNFKGKNGREQLSFDCSNWERGNYIILISSVSGKKFQRLLLNN